MQIKTVLEFSAASLTAFLVACFSPTRQEGLACSEEGLCPSGLACSADQICRSPDTVADGGSVDDASSTVPDAALSDGSNAPCEFSDTSICAAGPMQPAIVITGTSDELNTDNDDRCRSFTTAAGSNVCLIYTDTFEVLEGSVLRVVGSKPLFIASVGPIIIDGKVDASSSRNNLGGAGSNSSECQQADPGEDSIDGGGGGAGGSFQGQGGNGGFGYLGNGSLALGGNASNGLGGLPDRIRGGCAGSSGGMGEDSSGPSEPGPGGGAISFLSADSFSVSASGSLFANGGGGGGGLRRRGGAAGGGSGGMLIIEAPSVVLLGTVLAEGGGGGSGAYSFIIGVDGNDPSEKSSGSGGQGGWGNGEDSGDGGEGSTIASRGDHSGVQGIDGVDSGSDPLGGSSGGGGGGGGGGAGYLIIKADSLQLGSTSPGVTLSSRNP